MDPSLFPLEISREKDNCIRIRWKDNHVSDYPAHFLRSRCPCAGCVDEVTGERRLKEDSILPDIHALQVSVVGNYAFQIQWNDGHAGGIYAFAFLRELCPCTSCVTG